MGVKITQVEYFLPKKLLTNEDLEKEFTDLSVRKIEQKVGIKKRHIAGENETSLDLAINSAETIVSSFDNSDIDFLIFCTQSPDYILPASSCILQNRLGLNTNIGAIDINLGCSGYIYGLAIAKGLISSNISKKVLLITAETYSKFIHSKDKSNRTIFGDGAATTLIERSNVQGIGEFVLGTDGSGFDKIIVPNGGARNRYDSNAQKIIDSSGAIRTKNNLFLDGPEVFNFTIESVPRAFDEILVKNSIGVEDLDYIIFHQANKYMLDYLRSKIKIPEEKFYVDIMEIGNTVSATIPIAIKECLDSRRINEGDTVLLLGFGVGYSWGGTIVKF